MYDEQVASKYIQIEIEDEKTLKHYILVCQRRIRKHLYRSREQPNSEAEPEGQGRDTPEGIRDLPTHKGLERAI